MDTIDVGDALEELRRSSLIDTLVSNDRTRFVSVPLVAAEFAKRKLAVSPSKSAIETDLQILQLFGPGQKTDVVHGIAPRIARLFKHVNDALRREPQQFEYHLPILEYTAQKYLPAWLQIATLYERSNLVNGTDKAKDAIRRYLERTPQGSEQHLPGSGWPIFVRGPRIGLAGYMHASLCVSYHTLRLK